MIQRAYGQQLVIKWVDSFAAEAGFAVEAQSADGTWQIVENLPPGPGTGSAYEWHRVLDISKSYRVSAVKSGYTVPLETAAGQSEIPIELSSAPLVLSIFDPQPLSGIALIGVSNAIGVESVTYYLDGDSIATSSGSGGSNNFLTASWDSATIPDGRYWLKARATKSTGVILEHQQRVLVDNADLAASLNVSYANGSSSSLVLTATATSDAGIDSVEFLVDDTLLQTVTAADMDGRYRHTFATAGLPAESVTFKAIVRDNGGSTVEATRQRVIDNPPTLVLQSPVNSIVDPNLYVEGTFADDLPGATLTVTLGDTTILETSNAGTFQTSYSLAALPFGEHTLTFRVIDANGAQAVQHRNIVTQPEAIPALLTGTRVSAIFAVNESSALWETLDGQWLMRDWLGNVSGGGPALGMSQYTSFQIDAANLVMRATDAAGETHIYASGRGNISAATGATVNVSPVFRYPWVAWLADPGANERYEIYNVDTQERRSVPRPAGTNALGIINFDFVDTIGAEQLLFWANTSGTGSAALSEIFRYELATDTTHAVTSNTGLKHRYIETDNERLAWRTHLGDGVFQVFSAPLANPTDITTHTSIASWFALRDGQLVWTESNGDGTAVLKVNDGTTTTVVSAEISTANLAVPPACASIGLITFVEHGTVQMWDAIRGKRLLMNTVPPYGLMHDSAVGYFLSGTEGHRIYTFDLP